MFRRTLGNHRWLAVWPAVLLACALAGCGGAILRTPTPSGSATATQTPIAPTPTRVLALGLIAGTGGDGVYVRWLPSNNPEDRMRQWPEGTNLEVVGDDLRAGGRVWKKVKDPDGNVGWVPAEYMITATPTRTPSVTQTPTPTTAPTQTPTFTPVPSPTVLPTVQPTVLPTALPTVAAPATPVPTAAPQPTVAPSPAPTEATAPTAAVPTAVPTQGATNTPTAYNLELYATTESKSVAYASIEGYVRNVGNSTLENVQVQIQYYGSAGQTLSRGGAAIANSVLALGQTSYFKVLVEARPDMARFTVTFLDADGRPIPTRDAR